MIVNPYPRIQGEVISTYQLIQLSGASYGFAKSPSGYYFNCNGGIPSSAAVARFNFNLLEQTTIVFEYINNAETNCDYGLISEVDKSFTFDWNNNSNSAEVFPSSSSTAQTYSVVVPKGEHFIDIKFIKDSSANDNYDSFLIKITNEELRELPPQQINDYGLATSDKILKGNRIIGANGYPILGTGLPQQTSASSSTIFNGQTAYDNLGNLITGTAMATTSTAIAEDIIEGTMAYDNLGNQINGTRPFTIGDMFTFSLTRSISEGSSQAVGQSDFVKKHFNDTNLVIGVCESSTYWLRDNAGIVSTVTSNTAFVSDSTNQAVYNASIFPIETGMTYNSGIKLYDYGVLLNINGTMAPNQSLSVNSTYSRLFANNDGTINLYSSSGGSSYDLRYRNRNWIFWAGLWSTSASTLSLRQTVPEEHSKRNVITIISE